MRRLSVFVSMLVLLAAIGGAVGLLVVYVNTDGWGWQAVSVVALVAGAAAATAMWESKP